jgi:glutathione S-transferase
MISISFTDSTLYMTPRSPFARRVRLALIENKIDYEERSLDVFNPDAFLFSLNPLARIPILELKDGRIIIDSNLILQELYQNIESPLYPRGGSDFHELLYWQAISVGLSEKLVEFYLNNIKGDGIQDPTIKDELAQLLKRILPHLNEKLLAQEGQFLVANQLTQADIDLGTALGYLEFRYSSDWKREFTAVRNYYEILNKRPSFIKTHPRV